MTDLFDAPLILKAVSLWQPWASLVAAGYKLHETRHWATSYRGLIAIHAARVLDVAGAPEDLCLHAFGSDWRDTLPRGRVVAVGNLTRCRRTDDIAPHNITAADRAAGNFLPGRFAWTIDGACPLLEPVLVTGRQGLFNWRAPGDLQAQLGPRVDHDAMAKSFDRLARAA
jgi:hypothetical protein